MEKTVAVELKEKKGVGFMVDTRHAYSFESYLGTDVIDQYNNYILFLQNNPMPGARVMRGSHESFMTDSFPMKAKRLKSGVYNLRFWKTDHFDSWTVLSEKDRGAFLKQQLKTLNRAETKLGAKPRGSFLVHKGHIFQIDTIVVKKKHYYRLFFDGSLVKVILDRWSISRSPICDMGLHIVKLYKAYDQFISNLDDIRMCDEFLERLGDEIESHILDDTERVDGVARKLTFEECGKKRSKRIKGENNNRKNLTQASINYIAQLNANLATSTAASELIDQVNAKMRAPKADEDNGALYELRELLECHMLRLCSIGGGFMTFASDYLVDQYSDIMGNEDQALKEE